VSFSGQTDIADSYGGKESHPDFRKPEFVKPLGGLNIAVIHGGRDRNCPVERAAEMVELMKQNGIPVRFWLDREAGHEPPRDPAVIAEYRSWLDAAVRADPGAKEQKKRG
jgi:pimeloyl-ACP methyl ester carboxylesterase